MFVLNQPKCCPDVMVFNVSSLATTERIKMVLRAMQADLISCDMSDINCLIYIFTSIHLACFLLCYLDARDETLE